MNTMICQHSACNTEMTEPKVSVSVNDVENGSYYGWYCSTECVLRDAIPVWHVLLSENVSSNLESSTTTSAVGGSVLDFKNDIIDPTIVNAIIAFIKNGIGLINGEAGDSVLPPESPDAPSFGITDEAPADTEPEQVVPGNWDGNANTWAVETPDFTAAPAPAEVAVAPETNVPDTSPDTKALVELLDTFFTSLVEQHGLEFTKTVGEEHFGAVLTVPQIIDQAVLISYPANSDFVGDMDKDTQLKHASIFAPEQSGLGLAQSGFLVDLTELNANLELQGYFMNFILQRISDIINVHAANTAVQ